MNVALVKAGIVANVIVSNDLTFPATLGYDAVIDVTAQHVGPGDSYNGAVFTKAAFVAPTPSAIAQLIAKLVIKGLLTAADAAALPSS